MMRQDRFALTPALSLTRERVQGVPPSVILSLPAGRQAPTTPVRGTSVGTRRNLGRGGPSVSRNEVDGGMAAGDLKVAPTLGIRNANEVAEQ